LISPASRYSVPTFPGFKTVTAASGTWIEYFKVSVFGGVEVSVAVNVKTYGALLPALEVPEIFPSVETERPGGRSPAVLLHLRVPERLVALIWPASEYDAPTFPGFKTNADALSARPEGAAKNQRNNETEK